jgi:N6-adenosine-specific RNA methylase IME4
MNELATHQNGLPTTIEDLTRFVLIVREKLIAVRAEIRAIDKLGIAEGVRKQKLEEAQMISEAVLDAETKIGTLTVQIPKASGKRTDIKPPDSGVARLDAKPKSEIIRNLGFTPKQVERFETLAKNPEIVEQAKAEARENDDIVSRSFVLEKIKTAEREHKEQQREEKRAENISKVSVIEKPLEAVGLFQTIVIDPPWDWGDEGDVNQLGRAKPDYSTMPIEEIEALPIGKISDKDCHLYLWVTNRSLPKAFRLIEAWGFRYITCLTWVKPSFGMGNYYRGSTEQVLFAVKGKQPLKRHDVGTHFAAPRGNEHSAKPDVFYDMVQDCSYAPYIDVFGRKERKGWTVWGENHYE